MAQRKSQRFFIERADQDAKSELGWDEFQAIKYRSWQHHLAFTILASWFITETRLDWAAEQLPVTLFCLNTMRLIAYPTFLWLMFALYCVPLSHSPNSPPPSKLPLSLSNILITAPVLAILGFASSQSLRI